MWRARAPSGPVAVGPGPLPVGGLEAAGADLDPDRVHVGDGVVLDEPVVPAPGEDGAHAGPRIAVARVQEVEAGDADVAEVGLGGREEVLLDGDLHDHGIGVGVVEGVDVDHRARGVHPERARHPRQVDVGRQLLEPPPVLEDDPPPEGERGPVGPLLGPGHDRDVRCARVLEGEGVVSREERLRECGHPELLRRLVGVLRALPGTLEDARPLHEHAGARRGLVPDHRLGAGPAPLRHDLLAIDARLDDHALAREQELGGPADGQEGPLRRPGVLVRGLGVHLVDHVGLRPRGPALPGQELRPVGQEDRRRQ